MSAAAQNSSPSLRRVTGISAIYHAGSIAACRQGEKIALHIYTTEGEVLVHISERDFHLGCRGRADANGVPFRKLFEERAQEAASIPLPEGKVDHRQIRPDLSPETLKAYQEILEIYNAPRARGDVAAACRARGVKMPNFSSWRKSQAIK